MRLPILILLIILSKESYGQTPVSATPRIVATLILADSLLPSDDPVTFVLMDSIVADQKSVRDYYFPAFQKIVEKADGALAEGVGSYVLLFVKRFPKEFSDRFERCSEGSACWNNMLRQASFAGEETMMRKGNQKEYADLVNQLTSKYKNWRSDRVLSKFMERVDKVRREWKD